MVFKIEWIIKHNSFLTAFHMTSIFHWGFKSPRFGFPLPLPLHLWFSGLETWLHAFLGWTFFEMAFILFGAWGIGIVDRNFFKTLGSILIKAQIFYSVFLFLHLYIFDFRSSELGLMPFSDELSSRWPLPFLGPRVSIQLIETFSKPGGLSSPRP